MTIYEVVQAILQAVSDAQDHPYGGSKTDALEREEGDPIIDSRINDGFHAKVVANKLVLSYSKYDKNKRIDDKYEPAMKKMVAKLADYLKREFKDKTGSTLKLEKDGETYVKYEAISYVKSRCSATQVYTIKNYDAFEGGAEGEAEKRYNGIDTMLEERYEPEFAWKKWQNEN